MSDDDFENMMSEMFGEDTEPEIPDDVLDLTRLDLDELNQLRTEVDEALTALGEIFTVNTLGGREMHSRRAAIQIEISKRFGDDLDL